MKPAEDDNQQATGLLHFRSSSPAPALKRKYPTTDAVRCFLAGALGLVCIFAFYKGKNYCSHQCLHWWQQYATGMLHFRSSSPAPTFKRKHPTTFVVRCFLAGALGLEPRAYGFGDEADKSASGGTTFEVLISTIQ